MAWWIPRFEGGRHANETTKQSQSTLLFLGVTVFLLLFLVVIGLGVEEEATVTISPEPILRPACGILLERIGWGAICFCARWRAFPSAFVLDF